MRYILSIRGGGIRGIVPACCNWLAATLDWTQLIP